MRYVSLLALLVGAALILVGCSEQDAANVQNAANAVSMTGNPLLVAAGAVTSVIASFFVTKGSILKHDTLEYNEDDVAAMVRGLEKAGYVLTKKVS